MRQLYLIYIRWSFRLTSAYKLGADFFKQYALKRKEKGLSDYIQ